MKILQYKQNAVMAKSRAFYGKRLTQKDYESLLNCSCVQEIASYLRNTQLYSDILEKLSTTDISAGYLEFLITKNEALIFSKLCRYEMAFGQEIYNYFVVISEIRQILSAVRRILFGETEAFENPKNRIYSGSTDIDMIALSATQNMDDVLRILASSKYRKVIENCVNNSENEYLYYECAFVNFFHEYEYELVKKCSGKKSELLRLLSEKADTEFIDKLYRAKKYFSSASDRAMINIAPVHLTRLTKNEIKELLSAENEKSMLEILMNTPYKKYALRIEKDISAEQSVAKINYEKYRHLLRFSTEPDTVMFCYMFLAENEVSNLIHIIEGVKYKMNSSVIKDMLIGAGD